MPSKRRTPFAVVWLVPLLLLAWSPPVHARVTRITILSTTSPAFCTGTPPTCPWFGTGGPFEVLAGLADGVLDPRDPLNGIIQDIELGKDPDGKVRYTATFQLVKPVDMSKASGLMWQDVPNRGSRITIVDIEKGFGDVGLSSGWQGDNSGSPTGLGTLQTGTTNEWVKVPVARHHDGSSVTGEVVGRIVNRSGPASQLLFVQSNQFPYRPASLDTGSASITVHLHETMKGQVTVDKDHPQHRLGLGELHRLGAPDLRPTPRSASRTATTRTSSTRCGSSPRTRTCSGSGSPPSATSARSSSTSGRTTSATRIR